MESANLLSNIPDLNFDDYCVFGLATCFLKEEGEYQQIEVIEPIPSAALLSILQGIPTSYRLACGKSLKEIFQRGSLQLPAEFPDTSHFGQDFVERTIAATRTYKTHPDAQQLIPLGTLKDDLNYCLEKKRVLNSVNQVNPEDNIKQHSHTHQVL